MEITVLNKEIKALNGLCKAGKLFEVQDWIKEGRPVNPRQPEKGNRKTTPLEIAIDRGFHSLVFILLKAGAFIADYRYNALQEAVYKKRLDIIKLLVDHGADVRSVDMFYVFSTWDPEIMEYFISKGADVESDYPLAYAFCDKIRSALGVYKRHSHRFSSFHEQANIALRYHCLHGNLKWVSLMIWLGADPYAPGPELDDLCRKENDLDDEGMTALEYAASNGHYEIFKLKQIKLNPNAPIADELLDLACSSKDSRLLVLLLESGFEPAKCERKGTFLIQKCLWGLEIFHGYLAVYGPMRNLDTDRSREKMKMIHKLVKHGAKWMPPEKRLIKEARQSLIKMRPNYTVELISIMAEFQATKKDCAKELIRTPSIKNVIHKHKSQINKLIDDLP